MREQGSRYYWRMGNINMFYLLGTGEQLIHFISGEQENMNPIIKCINNRLEIQKRIAILCI